MKPAPVKTIGFECFSFPRKRFARPEHFYLGAIPGGRGSKRMLHSVLVFHLGSLRRSPRSCDRQRQGWRGSIFSKRGSQRHPRPGLLVARIIVALLWACPRSSRRSSALSFGDTLESHITVGFDCDPAPFNETKSHEITLLENGRSKRSHSVAKSCSFSRLRRLKIHLLLRLGFRLPGFCFRRSWDGSGQAIAGEDERRINFNDDGGLYLGFLLRADSLRVRLRMT